ncbi:hypothetical protein LTR74_017947 [Friedmanniomyces endolithicus]|nr:hypothetical protein LTR74_017947 [Friedmanniomyces endolithicus]
MAPTSDSLTFGAPRSAPGYFTVLFTILVISQQTLALYDPTAAMQPLEIQDAASARFIAINAYDLIGALQDNWPIYWCSFVSRFFAAALMQYVGGGWTGLVPIELGSAVVLGACMWYSARGEDQQSDR